MVVQTLEWGLLCQILSWLGHSLIRKSFAVQEKKCIKSFLERDFLTKFTLLKGMSSTFPKVRKMCFPNFRKIFSKNFPNFRKIFSFFPKVRKNIFRKFGKIKFRCSHLLSIVVRFLSQSTLYKTYFFQCHSQFESYEYHLYSPQKRPMEIGNHKWPLISHCNPDGEALRVTIEAFGVTSGYQFHWSRLTIQIPLFSFLTTCEGPNCSSWMQPFDLTSFFVDFS